MIDRNDRRWNWGCMIALALDLLFWVGVAVLLRSVFD